MTAITFPFIPLTGKTHALRREVRDFLAAERAAGAFVPECDSWMDFSESFSKKLGARGWLGMTWPKAYGGHERSLIERWVVTEELLAAGAPVGAHWISDRQSGPQILRYGTEEQKRTFLPQIAKGGCYFAIGMSEPGAGSDLSSARTKAERTSGGWKLSGQKVWTSWAHLAHWNIVFCHTSPPSDDRHAGFSQLLVDLASPGVTVRPIVNLTGEHHFNEIYFDAVYVPDERVLGTIGEGWSQLMSELAFERSGPERFMSTFALLATFAERAGTENEAALGTLVAELFSLRQMSCSVAGRLMAGVTPSVEAALVKDVGTIFEQRIQEAVREGLPVASLLNDDELHRHYARAVLRSPSFTLRGGTSEILRGVVARAVGLR
jgi:alkylation response protein AidB-like acyl-CoA dehydrogenase